MITIKEIAGKAGVSPGTVDRVLHGRGRVSKENEEKIKRIADENGYVPNQLARRLQRNRRLVFGVLIPDPKTEYGYWQQVMDGIEEARKEIEALDATIIYSFFDRHDSASFLSASAVLFSHHVSAYIVAPIITEGMKEIVREHPDIPYAFIDSSLPGLSPCWAFAQDPVAAGRTGARLMCLSPEPLSRVIALQTHLGAFNGEMRAEAFTSAFSAFHPDIAVDNICIDGPDEMENALRKILSPSPSSFGIFIVNDQASILCGVLENMNLLDKARIIGFDLSASNRRYLSSGHIFAIIGQRPRAQGHDAVMAMYNHFTLPAENGMNLSAPVDIYIKENIPESEHWL